MNREVTTARGRGRPEEMTRVATHPNGGTPMAKTPKDVRKLAEDAGVKIVDLRFMDFPGIWQHFTIPVDKLDEEVFEDGLGFDGSSIRGWQAINESDMLLLPQPDTAFVDPFTRDPDAVHDLQRAGPDHPRGLHPRPAQRRPQGRGTT